MPTTPEAVRFPSALNGIVQSESQRFFQAGRAMGDREIDRLLNPQQESDIPLLTITPDLLHLPDTPPIVVPAQPEIQ